MRQPFVLPPDPATPLPVNLQLLADQIYDLVICNVRPHLLDGMHAYVR